MLKIWGRVNSSVVQKVLWTAEELALEYERIDHGGQYGGNEDPEYLKINPDGLIPTIQDGEFVLWESGAIMRYLAAKYDKGAIYPKDLQTRAVADQWDAWHSTTMRPGMMPLLGNIGDIPIGVLAYRWFNSPIERPGMPNLEAWYRRLCERPAFQKALMQPITMT